MTVTTNICKGIDCPYNDPRNGCQRFSLALHCPLIKVAGAENTSSQYWLFTDNPNPPLPEWRKYMEDWLRDDSVHQSNIAGKARGFDIKYPTRVI